MTATRDKLRVAVNLRPLRPGRIGGLENAFRGTVDALLRRFGDEVELTLLTLPASHDALDPHPSIVARVQARNDAILAREWPRHDVLWCPFMFLDPEAPPIPSAVMIPDLQHDTYPQFFSKEELAIRMRRFRITARRATRILTLSEDSKAQICRVYGLASDTVVVTPLDCAAAFRQPADAAHRQRLSNRLQLPERYCLFPANAWPHKNHRTLLRALAEYRRSYGDPPHLVLTGVADMGGVDLQAEIRAAGVEDLVHCLGYVDKADLPHLYDGAAMLVFVSLFEGFGIPLVEAMRRGTSIVAARATSIPEVVGDCALLVDPHDAAATAVAMHEVLSDPDAARRRVDLGRERAERFSFEIAAERTLATLRAAADRRAPAEPRRRTKVFVVTPSFNQGRFLRATIDSVLAQDYEHLEYFVADGGSTDDSVDILRSYGDRVRWVSRPDGGQAAAINEAWRQTDADIVAWLNSDDVYLDGAVSKAVRCLHDHPQYAMVYGRAWHTDIDGAITEPYAIRYPFDRRLLAEQCFICQPATFLRREVFKLVELPDPTLRYCMDYDLWIRLSEYCEIGFLDAYLATSRMYAENKTLGEREGVFREIMAVSKKHFGSVHRQWLRGYGYYRAQQRLRKLLWFVPDGVLQRAHALVQGARRRRLPVPPFDDGWVGRRTQLELQPGDHGRVTISGESPHWPFRRPLQLQVTREGEVLARHEVSGRGAFAVTFEIDARRLAPTQVVVEANRTYVPARHGIAADTRAVSFRITGVEIHPVASAMTGVELALPRSGPAIRRRSLG